MLGGRGELSRKEHNHRFIPSTLELKAGTQEEQGRSWEFALFPCLLCVIAVKAPWLQEAFALSAPWDSADKWDNQQVVWDWALSVPVTMIQSHFVVAPDCIFWCWSGTACLTELFSATFSSPCCCCCIKLAALQATEVPFSPLVLLGLPATSLTS